MGYEKSFLVQIDDSVEAKIMEVMGYERYGVRGCCKVVNWPMWKARDYHEPHMWSKRFQRIDDGYPGIKGQNFIIMIYSCQWLCCKKTGSQNLIPLLLSNDDNMKCDDRLCIMHSNATVKYRSNCVDEEWNPANPEKYEFSSIYG